MIAGGIFLFVILIVYLFDFTKLREQNETLIEQNEKMISALEQIKTELKQK